jgi:ABC-type nickel/cobalt efflux system permease component RcnA
MQRLFSAVVILLAALMPVIVTTASAVAQTTSTEQIATSAESETPRPNSLLAGRNEQPSARGWYARTRTWLQRQQQSLNRTLAASLRNLKAQGSWTAALVLAGLSFLYGTLHAAGPGHGKAIIASYAVATAETVRRSIYLAFLAAFFQALSAIAIFLVLALVLKATGIQITQVSRRIEQVSFALIALFGLWLLIAALRRHVFAPTGTASAGGDHNHKVDIERHHDHALHQGHVHVHLPEPRDLAGTWSWRRAVTLAMAIGIRPCSGAIILLGFALIQGMLWAGIAGTFAMALGTAITVAALAMLAVGTRKLAERSAGERWGRRIEAVAGIGGACFVLGLGAVFFLASLGPAPPL